jgi:HD-GYP domain-containing protein (c-di-GMP phosphodiesterase class II)
MRERDLLQSGGFGRSTNAARAGYLPVALEHVPAAALEGIGVHLRVRRPVDLTAGGPAIDEGPQYQLYCAESVRFTDRHRLSLLEHRIRFAYIRAEDGPKYRRQTERCLDRIAGDPARAIAERATIVYETGVELMNELLADPDLSRQGSRLEGVARAVTSLVMSDPSAFSHLLAASHHDFYTATHMVNVATWMVPLAYELGHRDVDELNAVAQAGMLHDVGKVCVPEGVLNKSGALSDEEWALMKRHPEVGCDHLRRFAGVHPTVLRVVMEHHERVDGSGYPAGLKGDEMHPVSRICAVVDSFDAMTAYRPFKGRTLPVAEAVETLRREAGTKYDAKVVEAWSRLMTRADADGCVPPLGSAESGGGDAPGTSPRGRQYPRKSFNCPGRAHVLEAKAGGGWTERPGSPIVAHNVSQGGLGFLTQTPLLPGTPVTVYLQAKGWEDRALTGETVRCRSHRDRWHEVGMRFCPPLAAAPESVPSAADVAA